MVSPFSIGMASSLRRNNSCFQTISYSLSRSEPYETIVGSSNFSCSCNFVSVKLTTSHVKLRISSSPSSFVEMTLSSTLLRSTPSASTVTVFSFVGSPSSMNGSEKLIVTRPEKLTLLIWSVGYLKSGSLMLLTWSARFPKKSKKKMSSSSLGGVTAKSSLSRRVPSMSLTTSNRSSTGSSFGQSLPWATSC